MTDERVETHIVVADADAPAGARAMHFQEYWVRWHAAPAGARGGAGRHRRHARPRPGVLEAIAAADVVLLAPSNPVVSIGPILAVPGIRDALRRRDRARWSGSRRSSAARRCAGMADKLLPAIGVDDRRRRRSACTTAPGAPAACSTAGWSTSPTPPRVPGARGGRHRGCAPCRCSCTTSRPAPRSPRPRSSSPASTGRGARDRRPLSIIGVRGLPDVGPGDDLAALIAAAAPDLRDGDVVVVTSKIVSKAEGRLVQADSREDAITAETVSVVAQRGALRIVRTRHGLVLAAAGRRRLERRARAPCCCCRSTRTRRPGRCAPTLAERLGVAVAVIITDTAGRAWREGLVDIAIGVRRARRRSTTCAARSTRTATRSR